MPADPEVARSAPLPAGYVQARIGGTVWMVRTGDGGDLEGSGAVGLLEGPVRRAAAAGRGRGAIARLRIGGREAIGKRALHGGLLGGLLGGIYLGTARLESVLRASIRLRTAGVPTPAVIAAGWRPIAGPLNAQALLTEAIRDGASLHEVLLRPGVGPARRRALLRAAGRTVRSMHAAGFRHADLNLANLVVEPDAAGPRVHVVDLDGGRFGPDLPARAVAANLCRLLRSWEKWIEPAVAGRLRDLVAFLRGYSGDPAARRRLAGILLRRRSGMRARRWFWRRGAPGRAVPAS